MTQFIDLSIPITNDVISDPEVMRPKVTYMTHQDTWQQIAMFFPGLEKDDLPDGEGWAVEMLELSTHNGTHMDAPWHFHSTTDDGTAPAPSIDEAPLDRFMRPGVKLDFSHLPHGHVVSAAELEAAFETIDYELQPLDIVLIQSGAVYGTDNFIDQGVGLGAEALPVPLRVLRAILLLLLARKATVDSSIIFLLFSFCNFLHTEYIRKMLVKIINFEHWFWTDILRRF